jgi:uncharacterized protein (DUF1015 family)
VVDAVPFPAVRYDPDIAGAVVATSAPAYDDVGRFTYAQRRAASPYTVLELLASGGPQAYAAAGAAYERWRRTGVLVRDPVPAFYLYEEHELRHGVPAVQRGILAAVALEPLDGSGTILPHERVDAARVTDRLDRLAAVPLDVSPVFALYCGALPMLRELLDRRPTAAPIVALTDEVGVDHRIWAVRDPADVAAISEGLGPARAVIADGHHRYARALAHSKRLATSRGGGELGAALRRAAPWRRTLMYLVDASVHGPRPMPIHRVVRDLPADSATRLGAHFTVEESAAGPVELSRELEEPSGATIGLHTHEGRTYVLRPRDLLTIRSRMPSGRSERWLRLPTALLEHAVLPLLGVPAVEHRSDLRAAIAEVEASPESGVFLLGPTDTATVLDLAEAGEPMPAKTTSFQPKPRTGVIMREVLG